jgi:hypothetical protein
MKGLSPEQAAALEKFTKGRLGQTGQAAGAPLEYSFSGAGKVNGIACTKFTGKRGAEVVNTGCAAQPGQADFTAAHYQVFDRMRTFFEGFRQSMANSPMIGGSMSELADPGLKGFPVKVATLRNGQEASVFEIKSIATAALTADDFGTGKATESEMLMGPGSRR